MMYCGDEVKYTEDMNNFRVDHGLTGCTPTGIYRMLTDGDTRGQIMSITHRLGCASQFEIRWSSPRYAVRAATLTHFMG